MQQAAYIFAFILIVSAIVFVSITLAYLIDYFEKNTKLSAAFLSGIVFSTINSFPEAITSVLSSYNVGSKCDSIFSNLLGGNLFILFSLALVTIIFIKNFNKNKVLLSNVINIAALALCYILIGYATITPWDFQVYLTSHGICHGSEAEHSGFNLMSLFVMIIYVFMFIYSTFIEKKNNTENKTTSLPKWLNKINMQFAVVIFCSLSVGIIGISVGLSFVDEKLIDIWFGSEKGSFGATLLLGIPTSIPELISIILLCKIKNYDAAFQTIIGSCLFSLFALTICDALTTHIGNNWTIYDFNFSDYTKKNIWTCDEFNLIIFSLGMTFIFALYLVACKFKKCSKTFVGIFSGINILIFAVYLILGFYVMSFPENNIFTLYPLGDSYMPNLSHSHYLHNKISLNRFVQNLVFYKK